MNYLDISIESKSQGSDEDAGSMYEGNTSDSYSSAAEDDNDDFVLEGMSLLTTTCCLGMSDVETFSTCIYIDCEGYQDYHVMDTFSTSYCL